MARVVIDLDRAATILDVADRLRDAPADSDVVLVGAAGAPWLRNTVFVEVARSLAGARRVALVTSDPHARSLAASVHLPAYASVAALDRHELDATERLDRRRAVARPAGPSRLRAPVVTRRLLGMIGSLVAAVLVLLAVLVPSAEVRVAPATKTVGPLELELRAGPNAEIARTDLSDAITGKATGTATGFRIEDIKAKGSVRLSNRQTHAIKIAKGTLFSTADGVRFASTEERTLPSSFIIPPSFSITIGQVDVPIEASVPGKLGNVPANRITASPAPSDYTVTNPEATSGGDTKRIPVVKREDYVAATTQARLMAALQQPAENRLAQWRSAPPRGMYVVPRVYWKPTGVAQSEAEVVNKEVETFELTVSGVATAFAVPTDEPLKTAISRVTTEPGFALDVPTLRHDEALLPDPSGTGVIAWKITISGAQLARVDADRLRRTLAGRGRGEVADALREEDVDLSDVRVEPDWWPRMPLLDSRISIVEVPATASTP